MNHHICARTDCQRTVTEEARSLNQKFGIKSEMICLLCLEATLRRRLGAKINADALAAKQEAKDYADKTKPVQQ